MLFHFLNFSQCVVCMFGHKTIYKVTNLKVHSKAVGISLRLQGKLGFPYNVKQLMVKYVLLC